MPKKSIFRQAGAQHFQLVHRSQRDPLIHDPEASQHVLKAFERGNTSKKGKSRSELESALSPEDLSHDLDRANIGEASLYGVYYDDTNYDYMQHLRQVGLQEDGVDSMLLEAPAIAKKSKQKGKSKEAALFNDLPLEALPSTSELPRDYDAHQAVPAAISGLQPDMDPHLRQVLEALEDDAFVEDGLEDDFFGDLVADGERDANDVVNFDFRDEGIDGNVNSGGNTNAADSEGWEGRFAQFKKEQKAKDGADAGGSDFDEDTEGGDTVGRLPNLSVIGGKRRRKGTSDASGYSMSSSSMFRNEGLTILDERFDQVEKQYESDEDEEEIPDDDSDDEAPDLITSREDFNSIMDDFLDNFEILGGKMRPVLSGDTPAEKLETMRRAMGEDERVRQSLLGELSDDDDDIIQVLDIDKKEERWDCETILSTYTNVENHPRLIRARDLKPGKPVAQISLDAKTGLPSIGSNKPHSKYLSNPPKASSQEDEQTTSTASLNGRPKDESKEAKKARKQAVKQERQARRVEKKETRDQFVSEKKSQLRIAAGKEKPGVRKL